MQPKGRILLADDDRALRSGVADLLSALGLEVIQAETGPEAVEIGRRHRLHAALLDLHMPGQTGLEVIPLLRLVHAGLPCIVYSGDLTTALESTAEAVGAFAVLHKPVDPDVLRSEVLRAIASFDKSA
jgi:two-component system, response regulator PdtaR